MEWDLPEDRDVDTFWRHSIGRAKTIASPLLVVEMRSSFHYSRTRTCRQSKYGLSACESGAYPGTAISEYVTSPGDLCMSVMVIPHPVHGWYHLVNVKSDAPASNTDWPNAKYVSEQTPFLSVWLR